jgi:ABC-2 type transport system permease protein
MLLVSGVWLAAAVVWPAVRLPFEPGRWAAAGLAVLLAAAIQFLVSYVHGLLAFWTTRATGVFELQYGLSLFLAGRIAPLALLPPAVATVAGVLWFRYTLSFPVEVLTGAIDSPGAYARGLAMQLAWLAAWLVAYRFVWRVGVRRYEGVGG